MKLEDQVCSLELAKRLKELGVKQESLFRWVPGTKESDYEGAWHFNPSETFTLYYGIVEADDFRVECNYPDKVLTDEDNKRWVKEDARVRRQGKILLKRVCSAFTVAELGEKLPPDTDSGKASKGWMCWQTLSEDGDQTHWDKVAADQWDKEEDFSPQDFRACTEAEARAEMLIYLIENNLVTP